jgi:hypothetical protein
MQPCLVYALRCCCLSACLVCWFALPALLLLPALRLAAACAAPDAVKLKPVALLVSIRLDGEMHQSTGMWPPDFYRFPTGILQFSSSITRIYFLILSGPPGP